MASRRQASADGALAGNALAGIAPAGNAPAGDAAGPLRLAVDIGNTNTVIGMFSGTEIRHRWRLATRKDTTVDEIAWWLHGLIRSDAERARVRAVGMASVVPGLDDIWARGLEGAFGISPEVLDYSHCLGLKLDYAIPGQIGADRLANVLGAHALGYREGVVIDLGTATTFDVFADYTYWGGIICPGIQSSMRSLAQSASKLSEVELRWPGAAIGKTTDEALRIGILLGTVGQVEYLLGSVFAEKGMRSPSVIATGGLAPLLHGRSPAFETVEPDLTLIGINHLLTGGPPRTAAKGEAKKGKRKR
jgi:type III pantothenate kinase